ncbi:MULTISPECIES: hypothetical protein [Cupriavidus]
MTWAEMGEVRARMARLTLPAQHGGAAYTSWRQANEAIRDVGADHVDRTDVQTQAMVESIAVHGQLPAEVAEAICQLSPAAVRQDSQAAIRALIAQRAPALQAQYAARRGGSRLEP